MPPTHWTQRLHFGPQPRINHSMAYDAARQRVVVFGGVDGNGSSLGDTWVWDGSYWTQVAETGPSAREGHSTAYDAVHQEIVLFGGNDGATQFADTWTWDGVSWTQVAETGPAARTDHAAAYDEGRNVVTLFGGWDQVEFADTGIASVVVSPATVPQGGTITITVALSGPATAATTVQLAASLADQPGSLALTPVTIPQAQVDATATVVVPAAAITGDYTVSATLAGIVRTAPLSVTAGVALGSFHMVAAMPNPAGDELQLEEVHLRNDGLATIVLAGWKFSNLAGTLSWLLDNADGIAPVLQTIVVKRRGRPLTLTNNGGTIQLLDPLGNVVEAKAYGPAAEGVVVPLRVAVMNRSKRLGQKGLRRPPPFALDRLVQIPIGLKPHPKLRRRLQESRQP